MRELRFIRRAGASIVMAGALVLGACGGGGYDSGVDSSKPLDTLTDAEARTACESLNDYLNRQLSVTEQYEVNCTIDALGTTTNPDACRAAVSTCLAGMPERLFTEADCSTATTTTDCSAPVGQVERCVTADLDVNLDRIDRIRCDIAGNLPELMALQTPPPVPSACTSLEGCPAFRDGFIGR